MTGSQEVSGSIPLISTTKKDTMKVVSFFFVRRARAAWAALRVHAGIGCNEPLLSDVCFAEAGFSFAPAPLCERAFFMRRSISRPFAHRFTAITLFHFPLVIC